MKAPVAPRRPISSRTWLTLIVFVGALFRLWLWWRVPNHQPANDEVEYLQVARDLVAGRGWVFYESYHWLRAPLYPLFLATSLLLAGGDLRWAALPNIALSTATIPLFFLLSRAVTLNTTVRDRWDGTDAKATRAGLIAAAASAFLLPFATFASLWMSETLFTALFVGALITLLRWAARPTLAAAGLAGVLLGLATLTRSLPLAALPLLAVWMIVQRRRGPGSRPYFAHAGLCVLLVLAVIAPWTARNWLAYDHFIPVETGLSYNMWAFNEPRETPATIFETLEAIPNPGERADYATEQGMRRLREDPAILVRKLVPNWIRLWRIKPIQDRFLQASYYEDVPFGMFVVGLVLDDALYVLLLASAATGLALAPLDRRNLLLPGWLGYIVGVVLLTHGESRYQHLAQPVLLPYAAGLWAGAWWPAQSRVRRVAALGLGLFALLPFQYYEWDWASVNVRRGWAVAMGDRALDRGDDAEALAAYRRATTIDPYSADVWLKLGRVHEQRGELEAAAEAYDEAYERRPAYVVTRARLGDALRRLGRLEEARHVFRGDYSDQAGIDAWAWQHLPPGDDRPAPGAVDVGDGLDFGFVDGMYLPEKHGEQRVRWTGAAAGLRLQAGQGGTVVRLRLAAPRPDNRPVVAELRAGKWSQTVETSSFWRTHTLFVPPSCTLNTTCDTLELRIHSPTFVPAPSGSSDERRLGLLVDFVTAEAIPVD